MLASPLLFRAFLTTLACLTATVAGCGGGPCLEFSKPKKVGEFADFVDTSGLVASRSQPGVLFVHGDVESGPVLFAVDQKGRSLARFELKGATNVDWEDIATGVDDDGEALLYVGDIGDNPARTGEGEPRQEIAIYRFKEPRVSLRPSRAQEVIDDWERLSFRYPETPLDAETLLVDPIDQSLLIVSKETDGSFSVFRAPEAERSGRTAQLVNVGQLAAPGGVRSPVSGGDISPSGDRVILRTLDRILLWTRSAGDPFADTFGGTPSVLRSADEIRSEGISFSADGRAWFSAGEEQADLFQATQECKADSD